MSDYKDRAQRYHHAIREILLRDWDPVGVADVPEAQDEYDSLHPKHLQPAHSPRVAAGPVRPFVADRDPEHRAGGKSR